jgi:hypothetical protein
MPYSRPMTIVFVAIAAIAITALGFAGAVWGVSWFMHSPFVWRTISSGWFQAISDSLIALVPIAVSIYAAITMRGRTPRRGVPQ